MYTDSFALSLTLLLLSWSIFVKSRGWLQRAQQARSSGPSTVVRAWPLLPSQAAPNLTSASQHNLVVIQVSIKTSFTWQFELLYLIFIHFRLAQVTRLRQVFEMNAHCRRDNRTDENNWREETSIILPALPSLQTLPWSICAVSLIWSRLGM